MKIKRNSEKKIVTRGMKEIKSTLNIKRIEASMGMTIISENIIIEIKNMKIRKSDVIGINIDTKMIGTWIGKEEKRKRNAKRN